jgi:hypothetical protein
MECRSTILLVAAGQFQREALGEMISSDLRIQIELDKNPI